jgi:hypothetical protein
LSSTRARDEDLSGLLAEAPEYWERSARAKETDPGEYVDDGAKAT